GFDPASVGSAGLGCLYAGPQAAVETHRLIMALAEQGGSAVMTLPHTPLKCAGAPLKMTFIVDDLLRQAGARSRVRIGFRSALSEVFGVPAVNERVLGIWRTRDIGVAYDRRLKAVDPGKRVATFTSAGGDVNE